MARVILLGAPAAGVDQDDVPGHDILRLPYEDGVADPQAWLRDAADAWRRDYGLDEDWLRAVVLRFAARPTAAVLDIREMMARRLGAEGTRLVLAVPSAELAWTRAALDARPSRVRTYATTPAQLAAWVAAHPWPIPVNPALGGTGVRRGRGRFTPWSKCITETTPDPREVG